MLDNYIVHQKISASLLQSHDESAKPQSPPVRPPEDIHDINTACNNTLLRKRKLLVKNIHALTSLDDSKMQQFRSDLDRYERRVRSAKPKKIRMMTLQEMLKQGVGTRTQVNLSELISEREYHNQLQVSS